VSDAKPFYVTTPIYYVNDVPHLGHAYTTIVADALARCHQMMGDDVRYLTGTDEHGQKIAEVAAKRGITPQQHCDEVAPRFLDTWRALGLGFGDAAAVHGFRRDFIRTTDPRHTAVVRALWERIRARRPDDLYLATYQGWYCVGCEAFYTESQLKAGAAAGEWLCTTHEKPVAWVDKETVVVLPAVGNYAEAAARRTSRQHPEFIQPDAVPKRGGGVPEGRAQATCRCRAPASPGASRCPTIRRTPARRPATSCTCGSTP
jgi:methionyl-tRNA synthetase